MLQYTKCPICRRQFIEHSELQWKICKVILVKEFAGNCPGFEVDQGENWNLET